MTITYARYVGRWSSCSRLASRLQPWVGGRECLSVVIGRDVTLPSSQVANGIHPFHPSIHPFQKVHSVFHHPPRLFLCICLPIRGARQPFFFFSSGESGQEKANFVLPCPRWQRPGRPARALRTQLGRVFTCFLSLDRWILLIFVVSASQIRVESMGLWQYASRKARLDSVVDAKEILNRRHSFFFTGYLQGPITCLPDWSLKVLHACLLL